jgi:hypothetical protein
MFIIPSFSRKTREQVDRVDCGIYRFSQGTRSRDPLASTTSVSLVVGGEWTQLPQPKRGVFSGVTLFRFSLFIAYRD